MAPPRILRVFKTHAKMAMQNFASPEAKFCKPDLPAKRLQLLPGLTERFDPPLPGPAAQIIQRQEPFRQKRINFHCGVPSYPLVSRPSLKCFGGSVVAEQPIRTLLQQF
jgi:hypothetical protein